ncbi:50S ribosomal protein L24 [Aquicella lusitana]|uniref:Large ribosomal subunit protein uL24 n=1 Tax=Aquicella lusitana TaxID=254246 RepID=A0A370GUQ4_9COXI|nr:50S ribosomal protein L24 [Aquicella lusitana]RDI46966.1 LSU ribosomal protein L24P [Aquicella lusitana]VVC73856.1 50S ribosomal protein L24 [Aquicella lusitana]
MKKIRKGDEVIVIAGKDKGKKGVVLSVVDGGEKLLIDGINVAKKHVKANPNTGERGGIVSKSMPIHRSNVMVYDPTKQKGSRIGVRVLKDGQRVRYFKSSDQAVEVKE